MSMRHRFFRMVLAGTLIAALVAPGERSTADLPDRATLFDRIHQIVADEFFDPQLQGVDWAAARDRFRPLAASAPTREAFADVINQMLALLHSSHTQYLTPDMPSYFELLGVFESSDAFSEELARVRETTPRRQIGYVGIGLDTMRTEEGTFIVSIYDGLPADEAGLQVGDRLVAIDGQEFHPIHSFVSRDGHDVQATIQRERAGPSTQVAVKPRFLAGASMFHEAMQQSVRVVSVGPLRIGYVHVWSYAGEQYQDLLTKILLEGPLSGVDALVLDLRDGWGGASPGYLNLFHPHIPRLVSKPRVGEPVVFDQQWRRPTALLINERVRSGKEVFAWGFQQMGRGPLVGHTTAGAVTAGSLRFLPDQSVLYLAVADCEVDGVRLEGRGVSPTIAVDRPIPYCGGRDPQQAAAIEALTESGNLSASGFRRRSGTQGAPLTRRPGL